MIIYTYQFFNIKSMNFLKTELNNYNKSIDDLTLSDNTKLMFEVKNKVLCELNKSSDRDILQLTNKTR